MNRFWLATVIVVSLAASSSAHFVFLVPDGNSGNLKAIFSDTLKPDERVGIEKIENTKLLFLDKDGKEGALKWTLDKSASCYTIEVPGDGSRVVAGITDYGILQRGEGKPFWLRYYSKTIVGGLPSGDKGALENRVPVELVPVVDGGKIRFQALAGGKPAAKAEISVMVPGEEKAQDLIADEKGLTTAFDKAGPYGVRFRHVEAKSGEDKGKKYDEVRSYATLVVEFSGK